MHFDREKAKKLVLQLGGYGPLAESIGKSRSYVGRYFMDPTKKSAIKSIPFDEACAIADWIGIPIDELRLIPPDRVAEFRERYRASAAEIPILGRANSARGDPPLEFDGDTPLERNVLGTVRFSIEDPAAFALRVQDDYMVPAYEPGDVVIVSPAAGYADGRIYFLQDQHGRSLLKRVSRRDDDYLLISFHPQVDPETIAVADIKRIYRVVGKIDRV